MDGLFALVRDCLRAAEPVALATVIELAPLDGEDAVLPPLGAKVVVRPEPEGFRLRRLLWGQDQSQWPRPLARPHVGNRAPGRTVRPLVQRLHEDSNGPSAGQPDRECFFV